jgi:hypothetical protein
MAMAMAMAAIVPGVHVALLLLLSLDMTLLLLFFLPPGPDCNNISVCNMYLQTPSAGARLASRGYTKNGMLHLDKPFRYASIHMDGHGTLCDSNTDIEPLMER